MAQGALCQRRCHIQWLSMHLLCLFEAMRLLAFQTPMARTPPSTILLALCLFKGLVLLFQCQVSAVCPSYQAESRWDNGRYEGQSFLQISSFCFTITVGVHHTLFIWLFIFTHICWWVYNLKEFSWADWTNLIQSQTASSGIWINYLVSCAVGVVNYHCNPA